MHHFVMAQVGAGGGSGAGVGVGVGGTPDPTPVIAQSSGSLLGGPGIDGPEAIVAVAFAAVLIAVLYPLVRAFAKRMERGSSANAVPASADAEARLQRLEQSMEAMELELERISEGQRYTTKLLTERLPLAARVPQPGQGEKTLL
jgi:hypothetical protein